MKVVINNCYGGFGLSVEALRWLYDKKSPLLKMVPANKYFNDPIGVNREKHIEFCGLLEVDGSIVFLEDKNDEENRKHPDLIAIVEKLGDAASSKMAKLSIVEIPDGVDFVIDEYDGIESIHEAHRSWH